MGNDWNFEEFSTWGRSRKTLFHKQLNLRIGLWQHNYPDEFMNLIDRNINEVWNYLKDHPELDDLAETTSWWNDDVAE